MILVIVVVVVVSIYTAGAAAGAGLLGEGAAATAASASGVAVSAGAGTVGATFAAGSALLGGAAGVTAAIGAGIIGGIAGSIVGQGVGIAVGVQSEFSWSAVALAALGGGISGGLAGAGAFSSLGGAGAAIARAATGNALTQGIAVATGLQPSFNWKGVAAAAVGAGIGYGVGQALGSANNGAGAFSSMGEFGGKVARDSLTGFVSGMARAAVQGGKISVGRIASDAFGNALGSSLADSLATGASQQDNKQTAAQSNARGDFRASEINEQNQNTPANMGSGGGLRLGRAGLGLQPSASALGDWSREIDGGIMLNGSLAQDEQLGQSSGPQTYTIKAGDNPASLGRRFGGDERLGATIMADNGLPVSVRGARSLPIGKELTIRADYNDTNLTAGGALIGADTAVRKRDAAIAAAAEQAALVADQQRYTDMRVGAWSGRTNMPGLDSMSITPTSSVGSSDSLAIQQSSRLDNNKSGESSRLSDAIELTYRQWIDQPILSMGAKLERMMGVDWGTQTKLTNTSNAADQILNKSDDSNFAGKYTHSAAMALSVAPVGINKYDTSNITYHDYRLSVDLCHRQETFCTIPNLSPMVDYRSAPKLSWNDGMETGKQILLRGDPIIHSSNYSEGKFTNQTLSEHMFHSGTVESNLQWEGDILKLKTVGYGYGASIPHTALNYVIGVGYFGAWQAGVKYNVMQLRQP